MPFSMVDKHSYKMTLEHQQETVGTYCASESRMREIRLSGLGGGVLNPYANREEGCLP